MQKVAVLVKEYKEFATDYTDFTRIIIRVILYNMSGCIGTGPCETMRNLCALRGFNNFYREYLWFDLDLLFTNILLL